MPTSATGKAEGFTLVELLIVLTVIGLLSASVVMAFPDPGGSLRYDAEQFAARAKAVRDMAIVDGRSFSVQVSDRGYAFQEWRNAQWHPLARAPFEDQAWNADTALTGEDVRIVFDPTGLAEPAQVALRRDDAQIAIAVDAGGGISINE